MPPLSAHAEPIARIRRDLDQGRVDAAWQAAHALLDAFPREVDVLVIAGEAAYLKGDLAQAESLLTEATRISRSDAKANHVLGNVCHDLGKSDRAISAYRRALRAAPQFAAAHNDLGTAYFAKGWYREAEESFAQAVRLEPDSVQANQNLGEALRRQGKPAEARRMLQRALGLRVKGGLRRLIGRGRK